MVAIPRAMRRNPPQRRLRYQLRVCQSAHVLIKELKVYHAANFLEGTHQCQTDTMPMAGVLCFLLASFSETTDSACCPTGSLCRRFLVG